MMNTPFALKVFRFFMFLFVVGFVIAIFQALAVGGITPAMAADRAGEAIKDVDVNAIELFFRNLMAQLRPTVQQIMP